MKLFLISLAAVSALLFAQPVMAADSCGGGGVKVSVDVGCTGTGNPIYDYLRGVIKFVAGLVGLAVVINIIIGGLQYMTSQGDPGALTKAKTRIFNAVVSLIVFIFAASIINYLIPGGVLG